MSTGESHGKEPGPVALFLLFSDQAKTSRVLERAIQSQLSDLDVILRKKELAPTAGDLKTTVEKAVQIVQDSHGIAGFWYERVSEDQIYLYVIENRGDRILIRAIQEAEEGGRTEAAAVIVRMSIAELLRGGAIGIEVPEEVKKKKSQLGGPPTSDTLPAPGVSQTQQSEFRKPGESPSALRDHQLLAHHLSYAYYAHSVECPVNHGLNISFGFRPIPDLTVFAEYTFLSPLKVQDETLVLLYNRHPIRAGAKFSNLVFSRIEFGASLSLLFDYVTYEVVSAHAVSNDKRHLLMGIVPRLEGAFEVTPHFALTLSFGAEILINPEYYGYEQQGERRVLLDGFRVQPWMMAGILFSHFDRTLP